MTQHSRLNLGRGQALLWAAAPPDPRSLPGTSAGRRMAGLVRALSARREASAAEPAPSVDVTVIGAERLDGQAVMRLLEALRAQEPPPMIRLESDWTGAPWRAEALIEVAEALEDEAEAPFFVHGIVDSVASLTPPIEQDLAALAGRGIPLSAEIWLRRGVNDSVEALRDLIARLLGCRVRPYYLVDGEWLTRDERAADVETLVRGLRGWISGTGVPQWLRVSAAGVRELIVPEYVRRMEEAEVTLEDFRGATRVYRNPAPLR